MRLIRLISALGLLFVGVWGLSFGVTLVAQQFARLPGLLLGSAPAYFTLAAVPTALQGYVYSLRESWLDLWGRRPYLVALTVFFSAIELVFVRNGLLLRALWGVDGIALGQQVVIVGEALGISLLTKVTIIFAFEELLDFWR